MTFLKLDLDDNDIGTWVRRETAKGRVLTKPHYVESVVDGDPVTHCGRRLRRGTGYPFREVTIEGACLACLYRPPSADTPPVPEDDASTQPVGDDGL